MSELIPVKKSKSVVKYSFMWALFLFAHIALFNYYTNSYQELKTSYSTLQASLTKCEKEKLELKTKLEKSILERSIESVSNAFGSVVGFFSNEEVKEKSIVEKASEKASELYAEAKKAF